MAVVNKIRGLLRQKKGDEAVSFLLTTAMLVLIFVTLISAMIYIMQYYDASYLCRRVVRSIEITGVYLSLIHIYYAYLIIDRPAAVSRPEIGLRGICGWHVRRASDALQAVQMGTQAA